MLRALLRSLRPGQWVKNLFVLAPLVFSLNLTDPGALGRALAAAGVFCLASSAIYLINDVFDREEDRRHPVKRARPVASGQVPAPLAAAVAVALLGVALGTAWWLEPVLVSIVGSYAGLNVLYSLGLKRVVILDVMIISLGFLFRVVGGAAVIEVEFSDWLVLCTLFLSLFLALSKRRHELAQHSASPALEPLGGSDSAADHRRVLSDYSPTFLDQMINVVTASTVVAYSLYAVSPDTVERLGAPHFVYTIPMVLFGVFRYLFLVYQRPARRNPTEAILRDPPSLVNLVLWCGTVLWMLYGGG